MINAAPNDYYHYDVIYTTVSLFCIMLFFSIFNFPLDCSTQKSGIEVTDCKSMDQSDFL